MTEVDFYYGVGSRYSYLAASQLAVLEAETGCRFAWHPLNSVRLLAQRALNPFEGAPVSGQYDVAYREQDAARWAALYGVPFVEPRGRVAFDPELLALACTAAKRLGGVETYSRALFDATFAGGVTRIDEAECIRCCNAAALPQDAFARELAAPDTRAQHDATLRRAQQAGVFGVPTFVADGALFWGNDRLPLLRHHLARSPGR